MITKNVYFNARGCTFDVMVNGKQVWVKFVDARIARTHSPSAYARAMREVYELEQKQAKDEQDRVAMEWRLAVSKWTCRDEVTCTHQPWCRLNDRCMKGSI